MTTDKPNLFQYLESHITFNQDFLKRVVKPGDRVIDATCGNGNDTLFLLNLIGAEGFCYSYDIQEIAIQTTARRIEEEMGGIPNYELNCKSHEDLSKHEAISLIIYNLGYLPKGDHQITTRLDTTIRSISSGLKSLKNHGFISILSYHGHDSGKEKIGVIEFLKTLPPKDYSVFSIDLINRKNVPALIFLEKKENSL